MTGISTWSLWKHFWLSPFTSTSWAIRSSPLYVFKFLRSPESNTKHRWAFTFSLVPLCPPSPHPKVPACRGKGEVRSDKMCCLLSTSPCLQPGQTPAVCASETLKLLKALQHSEMHFELRSHHGLWLWRGRWCARGFQLGFKLESMCLASVGAQGQHGLVTGSALPASHAAPQPRS